MEVVSPSGSLEVKVVYPKELSSLVPVCYYQPVEEPLPIMWASTVGQAGSLSSSMRFGWGSIIFALKKKQSGRYRNAWIPANLSRKRRCGISRKGAELLSFFALFFPIRVARQ